MDRPVYRIGFTGTKRGMTAAQLDALRVCLNDYSVGTELHHGDCIGADAEAHDICTALRLKPVIHPPDNPRARAYKQAKRVLPPKPYLERNHDIVDAVDYLIAAPAGFKEKLRSGTWATVRYAKRVGKVVYVLWPNGVFKVYGRE